MNGNNEMQELKADDYSLCHICGASIKREGCSFHCWDTEYECGGCILGFIGHKEVYIDKECKNIIK